LGDNTGSGAVMLRPIRFHCVGVWLEQETNFHIKVTAKTYETDYEMSCTAGTRGRRKLVNGFLAPTTLRSLTQNTVGFFLHQSVFSKI
jgi:hypothetical protein